MINNSFYKIRKDFPEVFARRAREEREVGRSCINGVFLDELDPNRGRMSDEILEDCGISCELTIKELFDKNNHDIGENEGEN